MLLSISGLVRRGILLVRLEVSPPSAPTAVELASWEIARSFATLCWFYAKLGHSRLLPLRTDVGPLSDSKSHAFGVTFEAERVGGGEGEPPCVALALRAKGYPKDKSGVQIGGRKHGQINLESR